MPGPKPNVKPTYDQLLEENANLKRVLEQYLDDMDKAARRAQSEVRRCVKNDVIPIKKVS